MNEVSRGGPRVETTTRMRVKGIVFRQTMCEVERMFGPGAVAQAVASMPPEVREQIGGDSLLANVWYPVEWQRAMWIGIVAATGAGPEMLRLLGNEAVLGAVSTVYRPFLRLLTPATMVSVGAKLWRRVYDRGGYRVTSSERGRMAVRFEGCVGFDHTMWTVLLGTVEAFGRLSGARRVTVRLTAGGHDDDDWAELVARWED